MKTELPTDPAELQELLLAERARREKAEAQLPALLALSRLPELNPNPLLRVSAAGQLLYANPAAGYMARELEATGPSRLRPLLVQATTSALRAGAMQQREIMANNQHFLLSAVPMMEDNSVMLYLTDITAQRLAEESLREQYAFYESVMAHLPAVVTVLDPDQRYRYLNTYTEPDPAQRQARIGSNFADHCAKKGLPAELAVRRHRLFERAVQTRALVNWEERWPDTSLDTHRHWLCYYQPVFGPDGVLHQVMCYGLDITNLRQAEARIRQSEATALAQQSFTNLVLDLNPNLIWVRDAEGNTIFENAGMQRMRQHMCELAGTQTMELALSKEEIMISVMADQEVLRTGEPGTIQVSIKMPNGELLWLQTVRCPMVLADGGTQVLGVSTNITSLKAAQHAAEAAATARENFLANMSHEIRTPLNGVLGMTSLLAKTGLNEQQRNYTAVIQHSGRHLLNVVNDVLDMAKITSGNLELEQAPFNLCDSMSSACQPLAIQAQEKGIRVLGTRLQDSCLHPWVLGDSYRLNQVLINLVSNAIKFTPAGGTVTIGGYYVSETDDTLTTEFRVTDTGIGIAPDKLDSIFQEFTQAYADTTRQFGGTGLGLSISRALVAQMGGQLTVQSESGKGSSFAFRVTLPKASAEARQMALSPLAPVQEAAVRGAKVLLVEDNAVNREVAQLLLEAHGVVVDEAASGIEALELFELNRYDVVLMDIQMPGMNGLEATARIRAHADARRAATPILALTANAFRADAEKYFAAGMNDTLPKPFDEAELLSKLASLIAGVPVPLVDVKPAATAPLPPAPTAEPTPLFDLALLHQTAHGNTTFINRILASFHTNTPGSVADLHTALAASDWHAAAAVAHKLRPSLKLIGAEQLVPWMEVLESKTGSDAARREATQALATGLTEVLAALPTVVLTK
ncbi:response regulator [Hymenobacter artigasi]|uniref:histidine kinase n=1 Tax=Hymenobacter artigasi TaxID=2719616 RepID=A0ABX1HP45_9BACT|nr:response regulator [Hymenobacter artigasi]NKI91679.1 signal transduction histidine kinase/HPt (histidine-containing phosphotransfer) domain-containing protein/ActR/RegA family two-component response regulator [Hymenobacter artigasi]